MDRVNMTTENDLNQGGQERYIAFEEFEREENEITSPTGKIYFTMKDFTEAFLRPEYKKTNLVDESPSRKISKYVDLSWYTFNNPRKLHLDCDTSAVDLEEKLILQEMEKLGSVQRNGLVYKGSVVQGCISLLGINEISMDAGLLSYDVESKIEKMAAADGRAPNSEDYGSINFNEKELVYLWNGKRINWIVSCDQDRGRYPGGRKREYRTLGYFIGEEAKAPEYFQNEFEAYLSSIDLDDIRNSLAELLGRKFFECTYDKIIEKTRKILQHSKETGVQLQKREVIFIPDRMNT